MKFKTARNIAAACYTLALIVVVVGVLNADGSVAARNEPTVVRQVISEERGVTFENATVNMLGVAEKVSIDKDTTTIVDGGGDKEAVQQRAAQIRTQIENTKSDFDRVIAMDSADYDRIIQIYQALDTYGYKEVGKQYLQECMSKNGSKMNNYDMGRMYYYLGEYEQSYMILEKAKAKGDASTYLYLGKAYEATGDYNYASSVYNSWLAKDTGNAEIYNQLGLCEMQKGNYQSALKAFQAGMQIENNSVMQALSFNEIVAYENLEEYGQAAALMDRYLKNYPDDEQAKREYEFLKTR